MKHKNLFIVFEGADGCGKSTQIDLLYNYLKNSGYETIKTLEPGGCEIGKDLRKILLNYEGYVSPVAELFMYLADRAQHSQTVIKKALDENKIVLCDRYTDSTLAYQGYARKNDINNIINLNNIATNNLKPDLTFVLDIDTETAQQRVGQNKDRMESEGINFHKAVREAYLDIAKKSPKRYKIIDASLSIEEIFSQIKETVNGLL